MRCYCCGHDDGYDEDVEPIDYEKLDPLARAFYDGMVKQLEHHNAVLELLFAPS